VLCCQETRTSTSTSTFHQNWPKQKLISYTRYALHISDVIYFTVLLPALYFVVPPNSRAASSWKPLLNIPSRTLQKITAETEQPENPRMLETMNNAILRPSIQSRRCFEFKGITIQPQVHPPTKELLLTHGCHIFVGTKIYETIVGFYVRRSRSASIESALFSEYGTCMQHCRGG
jgi:hypothetical protein